MAKNSEIRGFNHRVPWVIGLVCSILFGVQFDVTGYVFVDLQGLCYWYIISRTICGIFRLSSTGILSLQKTTFVLGCFFLEIGENLIIVELMCYFAFPTID